MPLTSAKNPLLKKIRKAVLAGRRTDDGLIVIEGPHLLQEALGGEWGVEQVFFTEAAMDRHAQLLAAIPREVVAVSQRALSSISSTQTSQGIVALLRPCEWCWNDLAVGQTLLVVLDGIQDPGNAGTIVRTAEAFGATGVVLLNGSVGVANGKFLRSTAGSIFRVPFLEKISANELFEQTRLHGLRLYALAANGKRSLPDIDLRPGCAWVVGSEGAGVSPELLSRALTVAIPASKVESLNAAIAASIALFETSRQRSTA
jgi:RNA methyltransferase, TrmH family